MTAMDKHVRFELTIPGDDGHVAYRTGEAINALVAAGFRLAVKLDGPTYLLQDHEAPVDSSTVDLPSGRPVLPTAAEVRNVSAAEAAAMVRPVVMPDDECGMAVCGHTRIVHDPETGKCEAGVAPGRMCACPGWTPVTRGLIGPKPLPY